ncbi:MAG: TetR/AcrR family transcriptional regulator [Candidatus Acidulodesulfobacterium ferriphilum]|jgi:AcrR family transcriptional regulator|uniref:TetR/AcrR family transcriptional regulator n=1 Tax=Candidatus Acidulodesulfobacterium ferriphilum TaxID=2597223 RepID=A0A519B9T7_9DELT|nr:MAG: TetR/AcrR family transcriptional regulator [Candidatus Acidulodesulfobacterium ferriphilum]
MSSIKENIAKKKIFEFCIREFARAGYANVSIRNISKGVGISIGAIYYYFSSKEQIGQFLYDKTTEIILNKIRLGIKKAPNDKEALRSIIYNLFDMSEKEPHLMEFILYVKHKEFLPDAPPICSSKPFEFIKNFIKEKIESGVFRDMDIVIASALIMGPVIRIIQLRMDNILKNDIRLYTKPLLNGIVKSIFKKQA